MSAQPGNTVPVIRTMQVADLRAVANIEKRTYEFPWGQNVFSDCLMAGYDCVVLDDGQEVIGYAILSVAAAEAHILNLCIDVELHRRGYGQQLLDYLLEVAAARQVERLFLEVRPSNEPAIKLYEKAGFGRLGIRKAYYRAEEGREDALVLVKEMPSA